jgi:DNA-directed RNA polymerase alpha subunit
MLEHRRRRRRQDVTPVATTEQQILEMPLAETTMSARVVNALERHSWILVKDLIARSRKELTELPNFGEQTFRDIAKAIRALGLKPANWRALRKPRRKPTRKKRQ